MTPSGTMLWESQFGGDYGKGPRSALVQASDGNFYGTNSSTGPNNAGTIFRVTANGELTHLRSFTGGAGGATPFGALVQGSDGYLYGTSREGGTYNAIPAARLIQATDGNLYGTTIWSGCCGGEYGTVFRLTPGGAFSATISRFGGSDGSNPRAPLYQAADGNFYGTTTQGGASGYGTVFRIRGDGTGRTVLHSFTGGGDGAYPEAGLIQGSDGALYGATRRGGSSGTGVVYRLSYANSQPLLALDTPHHNAPGASFTVSGWAIDRGAASGTGIDAVRVFVTPLGGSGVQQFLGDATYGLTRADIGSLFGSQFTPSGYSLTVSDLPVGSYIFAVYARSTVAGEFVLKQTVSITVPASVSQPAMVMDVPTNNTAIGRNVTIAGWAIDRGVSGGTGVDTVHVWAYPSTGSARFLGVATYGLARPDVGSIFGSQFTISGYQLRASMNPGTYTLVAFAHSRLANAFNAAVSASNVTVQETSNPVLVIDAPGQNISATRPFAVSGWAIDRGAETGTGIDAVHVWAFPTSGVLAVFVGAATYGSLRPDVGSFLGDARFTNSGYTLTVTASNLAAGTYDLAVFGRSTVTGSFSVARVVRVTVQ